MDTPTSSQLEYERMKNIELRLDRVHQQLQEDKEAGLRQHQDMKLKQQYLSNISGNNANNLTVLRRITQAEL